MTKLYFLIGILFWGVLCQPAAIADSDSPDSQESGSFLWGDFKAKEGLRFTVRDVELGEWAKTISAESADQPPVNPEPLNMIAITYELKNEIANRKIDLTNDPIFSLTDEFGNAYQRLEKPSDYAKPAIVLNKHFPSLYPEESITSCIFFEAPVKTSQVLNLNIDAQSLGVTEKISFRLPVDRVLPPIEEAAVVPSDDDLKISIPKNLKLVRPGDAIPINVQFTNIDHPDSIYIIAPFYVYQDTEATGHYTLRIPKRHQEGPLTVVVLASWKGEKGEQTTVSRSFTVLVKNRRKPCVGKCADLRASIAKKSIE